MTGSYCAIVLVATAEWNRVKQSADIDMSNMSRIARLAGCGSRLFSSYFA